MVASSTIFRVFGMTQPGIEPRSSWPLVNTLLIRPMWFNKLFKSSQILTAFVETTKNFMFDVLCLMFFSFQL